MKPPANKNVIIITGPTGVGKTTVALRLAEYFNTEIISADSRQCFKELNIGVARPSPEELQQVTHHFIASHSIKEQVTAITFEQYALEKVKNLFKKHEWVIMAGGTGLYIKAFCEGLDEIPEINTVVRNQIVENYNKKGLQWLQQQVKEKDPAFYATGEIQNPQRLMRAMEVAEATGQSILSFRKGGKINREFNIIKIGIELPKEELNRNINARVDNMIKKGLLDEVQLLLPYRHLNALQTVGYAEFFNYIDGNTDMQQAITAVKTHTRQYAKRQMTWFKKDAGIKWFAPQAVEEISEWVKTGEIQ